MIDASKAAQLVEEVLLQGGMLLCKKGLVMHKEVGGSITFSFLRNMSENSNAEEMYNGISATKAAFAFTEWVGALEALGLATKWFREKNKVVETKTTELAKVEKHSA